jgi:hypothetical protein
MSGISDFTSSGITVSSITVNKGIFYGSGLLNAVITGFDVSGVTFTGNPNSGATLTAVILKNSDVTQVKTLFEASG